MKLALCTVRRAAAVSSAVLSFLATLLRFFERLTVVLQATGPAVVLSRQDVGVTDNC